MRKQEPNLIEHSRWISEFNIQQLIPVDSKQTPLVQLADVFAGMAAFSWNEFEDYKQSLDSKRDIEQARFLEFADTMTERTHTVSSSKAIKFEVLRHFDAKCKGRELGVGLKSSNGLCTRVPGKINFWRYAPQTDKDKAPRRQDRHEK